MGNSISYRLTLKPDNIIDLSLIGKLKKMLVDDFDTIETRDDIILFTNENDAETLIFTDDLIIMNFSDFLLGDDLPSFLVRIFDYLKRHDISLINSAKIVLFCNIENVESSNFSSVGFKEGSAEELSEILHKDVNSIGLKFSLDDDLWHYEIEILPDEPSEYLLKMDCFYDSEVHEESENGDYYLSFNDILDVLPVHRNFLIEDFAKQFIKFK